MSKSPPRYVDQTIAKWTAANDDHVLKGPESALVTVLDAKEFSILDHDIVMRRARQAQAQTIGLFIGQLGRAVGRVLTALWVKPLEKYRGTYARAHQAKLIRSLPDHLLRDIGIEPPSRFRLPPDIQTRLTDDQTFWR